jgi:hypothetical protein
MSSKHFKYSDSVDFDSGPKATKLFVDGVDG